MTNTDYQTYEICITNDDRSPEEDEENVFTNERVAGTSPENALERFIRDNNQDGDADFFETFGGSISPVESFCEPALIVAFIRPARAGDQAPWTRYIGRIHATAEYHYEVQADSGGVDTSID